MSGNAQVLGRPRSARKRLRKMRNIHAIDTIEPMDRCAIIKSHTREPGSGALGGSGRSVDGIPRRVLVPFIEGLRSMGGKGSSLSVRSSAAQQDVFWDAEEPLTQAENNTGVSAMEQMDVPIAPSTSMAVANNPGAIVFTRIPLDASSRAIGRVIPTIPPFEAE